MIRLSDIQKIQVTETELNLLAGLIAPASKINILNNYTGTAEDLNQISETNTAINEHLAMPLHQAHTLVEGSFDGGLIADGTILLSKLGFDVATQAELNGVSLQLSQVNANFAGISEQIDNLYSIVLPGQSEGIAEALNTCINHVSIEKDAHDATAISYGQTESGYYLLTEDVTTGMTQINIGIDRVRYFRKDDRIHIYDDNSLVEEIVILYVDYEAGIIGLASPVSEDYTLDNNAKIENVEERNVQQGIDRCLKNATDKFSGTLEIENIADTEVVLNSGIIESADGYHLDLEDGSLFELINDSVAVFSVDEFGQALLDTILIKDFNTNFTGLLDKEELSQDVEWILPNRSGYIGIGDVSFSDMLKVSYSETDGSLIVSPGFTNNYDGEIVRVWITMEEGSKYEGETVSILEKITDAGLIGGLNDQWIAIKMALSYDDNLIYHFSDISVSKEDAISAFQSLVPSSYMKLALIVVQGDGAGSIDTSTLEIIEDMRPFLTLGMASAYYDESVYSSSVITAGTVLSLPANSRNANLPQDYILGSGQLEVFVNELFQEPGRNYYEVSGSPAAISFTKDLPPDTVVRYRMLHGAAGASISGGSGGSTSLQGAYEIGPLITTTSTRGPIRFNAWSTEEKVLQINGDIGIEGFVDPPTGYGLSPQTSEPKTDAEYSKIWADVDGRVIVTEYSVSEGTKKSMSLIEKIESSSKATYDIFQNNTGATIPAYSHVAISPYLAGHIVLGDVSTPSKYSRLFGVTLEAIPHGGSGYVVTGGRLVGGASSFSHGDLVFANPTVQGGMVTEEDLTLANGNVSVIIGTVDGNDLIVNITRQGVYSS